MDTGSWEQMLPKSSKVFPHEYKRVLARKPVLAVQRAPRRCSMGKVTGFLEYTRQVAERRPPAVRIRDWFEIYQPFPEETLRSQGARCMDCGVPFAIPAAR